MSSFFKRFSSIVLMGILSSGVWAAGNKIAADPGAYVPLGTDTIVRNGYTLIFINQDKTFDPQVKHKMVHTFFQVYPALARQFNPATLKTVTFVMDTTYNGVAGAANGQVSYSPEWLRKHPGDIDVVTHEVMHIVQNYPGDAGPGWITEGIADYVRYKFGLDNASAGWALPEYQHGHSYTNSYRITARFLAWIEQKVKPGFVTSLDASMRTKKYAAATWQQLTGKTMDELWKAYSANPAL
ncbi:basic secretory protein-like protein [Chitinophaga defluvii]|uniref:Basic secretory protein-like protein n=1 Tax=Chitinophaga defluvii TaxID=3163343 RepID=A0ABV2T9Y6_9BACT